MIDMPDRGHQISENSNPPSASTDVPEPPPVPRDERCGAGLTVISRRTATEYRCSLPSGHPVPNTHRSPLGTEWTIR